MDDKKQHILNAALRVVTDYGFKRTSMEDIAREAGVSRPAIYQWFRNKDDVFLSCLDMVIEQAFSLAETKSAEQTSPKAKVAAYLKAYMGFYHSLLIAGRHGQELLDLNNRLGAQKSTAAMERFIMALNALMQLPADAEEGHVLAHSAAGIKYQTPDPARFNSRLDLLLERFLASDFESVTTT